LGFPGKPRSAASGLSELVRDAENGEVILIERRGEPVAELRPVLNRREPVKLPDMRRFWNEFPKLSGDSTEDISEDRER
jgi:antitoxin (DNA-binding transcriptional repressor) of toxin-antitoxin stability system